MAQATTFRFGEFLILISNGATPPVFGDPCGATSKGFNRTAALNETNTPDCADPDLPSWLERDVVSNSAGMQIAGVVADESFDVYDAWYESGESKEIRVELGARAWQGFAKLGNLNITAERGQRVNFNGELMSDGAFLRVAP